MFIRSFWNIDGMRMLTNVGAIVRKRATAGVLARVVKGGDGWYL